jgi:hypothetical protein
LPLRLLVPARLPKTQPAQTFECSLLVAVAVVVLAAHTLRLAVALAALVAVVLAYLLPRSAPRILLLLKQLRWVRLALQGHLALRRLAAPLLVRAGAVV